MSPKGKPMRKWFTKANLYAFMKAYLLALALWAGWFFVEQQVLPGMAAPFEWRFLESMAILMAMLLSTQPQQLTLKTTLKLSAFLLASILMVRASLWALLVGTFYPAHALGDALNLLPIEINGLCLEIAIGLNALFLLGVVHPLKFREQERD
jgi:hypothetical protein